jgi:hypothetical protein
MGDAAKDVVTLRKAIQAHGAETKVLKFREPNGDDIMECGMPFDIHPGGTINLNTKAIGQYIARLADIPPSSVKQLSAGDFAACVNVVAGFFGDAMGAT